MMWLSRTSNDAKKQLSKWVSSGNEGDRPLVLCRGRIGNNYGLRAGNLLEDGKCRIGYGGKQHLVATSGVLINWFDRSFTWVAKDLLGSQMEPVLDYNGQTNYDANGYPVCRGTYQSNTYAGYVFGDKCVIGVDDREEGLSNYEVLALN